MKNARMALSEQQRAEIAAQMSKTRRTNVDGTSMERRSTEELILALKYDEASANRAAGKSRLKFFKPPGTVNDTHE